MAWRKKLLKGKEDDKRNQELVEALVPYTIDTTFKAEKKFWPSTVFFNASYRSGILWGKNKNYQNPYFQARPGYAECTNQEGLRAFPFLSEMESKLWCHKHAAHTAVARRFPVEVGRLLGTITLEIQELSGVIRGEYKTDSTAPIPPSIRRIEYEARRAAGVPYSSMNNNAPAVKRQIASVKKINHKHAIDEIETELLQTSSIATLHSGGRLARVHAIQEQWKVIQDCKPCQETWDPRDGSYSLGYGDDNHVTLKGIQRWLERGVKDGTLVDLHQDETKELYDGLTSVPIDAMDVLQALVNLANVEESIYGVPLVTAYPRMERSFSDDHDGSNKATVWKIQLGVYMHRLLPEIFCCQSLHIIMSALDAGSYTITEPLRLLPEGPKVFESAPYPKVDLEGARSDKEGCSVEVIDVDDIMEERSRDDMVVSAFSAKGLLKLLENKGCDVSDVRTCVSVRARVWVMA
jgi:hypothetical protein